jgi:enoyl-CoA hydratase
MNLSLDITDHVGWVTMARPPVNAVDQAMYAELEEFFLGLDERHPELRAVVLAGAGKHFCGGNDLEEFRTMNPGNAPDRMAQVRRAFFAISDCPIPVIGAVQGTAVGTGLALAASCDFVIAAESARFGVPEVSVGVMGGARHLARLVPEPLVRWMYFTAEPISAHRMQEAGGVIAVVPDDELLAAAGEHAALIARHSPVVIRFAKRSLNEIESMELKPGYEFEQSLTTELSGHEDSKEAVAAFFERRPPQYVGR